MPQSIDKAAIARSFGGVPVDEKRRIAASLGGVPLGAPTEDTAAILADQARRFPTNPVTGVDTGSNLFTNILGGWNKAGALIHSPLESIKNLPAMVKGMVDPKNSALQAYADREAGVENPDPYGLLPITDAAIRGDNSTVIGDVVGQMIGTGATAAGTAGVVKGTGSLFRKVAKAAPTVTSLEARAAANRAVGGNVIDDMASSQNIAGVPLKLARNLYAKTAAPIQEAVARRMDARNPAPRPATADQYRPQWTEPTPVESAPIGAQRPGTTLFQQEIERMRGIETPEQLYARQQAQRNTEFTPAPTSERPLNIPRPPAGEIPRAAVPVNTLAKIEEAIAPSGNKARKFTQMVDGEGNPTRFGSDLVEVVPDITTATTETAPRILKTAITKMEQGIEAAEAKIPPATPVIAEPIADKIAAIIEDFAGDERSVMQLTKEWERWAGQKSVPFEEFVKIKRNVGKTLTTPALRRAYRVLVDASAEISDELKVANKNYSTVRRAMENGGIDVQTGRRVATVGKPQR